MIKQIVQEFDEMTKKSLGVASQACERVIDLGYAPAGHNGPYGNAETPMRNTAHWLMGFSYAYQWSGEKKYLAGAKVCAEYLMDPANRPEGAAFLGSKVFGWDGLIGQAWVIEALCESDRLFGQKRYSQTAKEVFLMHDFDQRHGLWRKLGVDGSIQGVDAIVHHQIWFAATGGILANISGDERIRFQLDRFLKKLNQNLLYYRDGLIMQGTVPRKFGKNSIQIIDQTLGQVKRGSVNPLLGKGLRYKESAYHLTNLYALAMLKREGFGDAYFRTNRFKRSLNYGFSNFLVKALEDINQKKDATGPPLVNQLPANRYAYAYNAPGFAMPYIYYVFMDLLQKEARQQVHKVVQTQIEMTYSHADKKFTRNTEDGETLNARVCQFLRCVTL